MDRPLPITAVAVLAAGAMGSIGDSGPDVTPLLRAVDAAVAPATRITPVRKRVPAFTAERVRSDRTVALRRSPSARSRVVAKVGATTQFGSAQLLSVAKRRGRWLGVLSPAVGNGKVGWVDSRSAALDTERTLMSVRIDLSRKRLEVLKGTKVVRRADVGIGGAASPTPTGRFSVTDKIPGTRYGPYYGCCILALSANQPNTPPGWTGGNRIAIHGTDNPASIGAPASAGCVHARKQDLELMMRRVPLGAPVFIRR